MIIQQEIELSRIQDTNYAKHVSMVAAGDKIMFTRFPMNKRFDEVMIVLATDEGRELCRNTFQGACNFVFYPGRLDDGKYTVSLFTFCSENYFSRYLRIPVKVRDGNVHFLQSPVLIVNNRFLSSLRRDTGFLKECLKPNRRIQSNHKTIKDCAAMITDGCSLQYSKMIAIHDWVAGNIGYDYDALEGNRYRTDDLSSLAVLKTQRSVCSGYHNLTAALLRSCGIPSCGIECYALTHETNGCWFDPTCIVRPSNHIITAAFVGGEWRLMDVTWDSDNKFEGMAWKVKGSACCSWRYCDPTVDFLSITHRMRNCVM